MLIRSAVIAAAAVGGVALASTAPVHGAEPVLDGTYRLDYDGADQVLNDAPLPTASTSSTYTFTSSCTAEGCVAHGILLNSTDTETVTAHNPNLTLHFADGAWQLSLPYDSPCEEGGARNQLLTWTLAPQNGNEVLSGSRTVATVGHSCVGDETGSLSQHMTATRIGDAAPGVLPSW